MILKVLYKKYYDSEYQNYRGVDRKPPSYVNSVSEDHESNRLFFKFLEHSDNGGATDNLELCKELVKIYRLLEPPQELEIIETTDYPHESLLPHRVFLGYDLVFANTHSLLALTSGLRIGEKDYQLPPNDPLWTILPLLRLTKEHFRPRLNANGLFDDYETAKFCLDAMMALQQLSPNLWEDKAFVFEPKGVWAVGEN